MRHVVDTSELSHLWAHRSQPDARNKQGNFYFDGDTIYSYGAHFPIARHVTHNKRACILFTTHTYSNTTSGHIASVRGAIHGLDVPVFHVDSLGRYGDPNHADNWEGYLRRLNALAKKIGKARQNRDSYLAEFGALVTEANAYSKFFGLRKSIKGDHATIADEYAKNQAKIDAAARKAAAEVQRYRDADLAQNVARWLAGENVPVFGYSKVLLRVIKKSDHKHRVDPEGNDVIVDTENDVVQTSLGATFPLDHARRAFKLIMACRANGQLWTPNGHTAHLGHYAIDSINANGDVRAGCHIVAWEEIERIAQQIGLITPEAATATA